MVIEWLKFKVPAELREKYIQMDDEIWTPLLAQYSGYLGKEIWINPNDATEVVVVIRWESRDAWSSVSADELEATEAAFSQAMNNQYELVEEGEYQVRKFPQSTSVS